LTSQTELPKKKITQLVPMTKVNTVLLQLTAINSQCRFKIVMIFLSCPETIMLY